MQVATTAIEEYDGQQDDISNGRKVLVYNYYDYSASENPTPKQIYLGDYNMISSINLADDGTLTIDYTHDDTVTYTKKIKWIDSVTLNPNTGAYKIQYNDGTEYNTQLVYPSDLSINTGNTEGAGNQKVHVTYTNGTGKDIGNPINYIMRTACNINTAWHLYILYADPAKRGSVTYDGRND